MWALYTAGVLWLMFILSFLRTVWVMKGREPLDYVLVLKDLGQLERLEDAVGRVVRKARWRGEPFQVVVVDETGQEEVRRLIGQLKRRYGHMLKLVSQTYRCENTAKGCREM